MSRAAIRYAKAILNLAKDQNTTDLVNSDMQLIASTIEAHPQLDNVLNNPVIKAEAKKTALLAVFSNLNTATVGLLDVLMANKRLNVLHKVALNYNLLYNELNQQQTAIVTTATPLTEELKTKVLAKIKTLTDKTVSIENNIDESILGGFILRVGDKQYNASISHKLKNLKREFTLN